MLFILFFFRARVICESALSSSLKLYLTLLMSFKTLYFYLLESMFNKYICSYKLKSSFLYFSNGLLPSDLQCTALMQI